MRNAIQSLTSLPGTLYTTIFNPDATPHDLLLLTSALALMWHLVFQLLHKLIMPYLNDTTDKQEATPNTPHTPNTHTTPNTLGHRLRQAMGREYDRIGHLMCKALGVEWTRERYIEIMIREWPKMQGIYLQHFVGGALCLPAVFSHYGGSHGMDESYDNWAASLACLGILSEMGWELSDITDIFLTRTTLPDGRERIPNKMVAIWLIHHSMTLSLGLPMVLNYRNLRELHLMTFNLQWAAAIAIGMNEYTKFLNLHNKKELWTFRILNGVAFVIMAYMRGFQWVYLSAKLLGRLYEDEEWGYLVMGSVVCVLISGFNFILCIVPFYKKMIKFGPKKKEVNGVVEAEGDEMMDGEEGEMMVDKVLLEEDEMVDLKKGRKQEEEEEEEIEEVKDLYSSHG